EGLSHACTGVGGLDGVENVLDLQTGRGERLPGKLDCERGGAALSLELQVDDALHLAERANHLITGSVENIEVIAKYFDGDLRNLAAQALADAVAEEGDHLALYPRIVLENAA